MELGQGRMDLGRMGWNGTGTGENGFRTREGEELRELWLV